MLEGVQVQVAGGQIEYTVIGVPVRSLWADPNNEAAGLSQVVCMENPGDCCGSGSGGSGGSGASGDCQLIADTTLHATITAPGTPLDGVVLELPLDANNPCMWHTVGGGNATKLSDGNYASGLFSCAAPGTLGCEGSPNVAVYISSTAGGGGDIAQYVIQGANVANSWNPPDITCLTLGLGSGAYGSLTYIPEVRVTS